MQHQTASLGSKIVLGVLGLGVLWSAYAVVYTKHRARQLFAQLQLAEQDTEALQIEWRQLLLEQGTWTTDARVERIAKERLQMHVPEPNHIVVISSTKSS